MSNAKRILITDTSVLINFLNIDRIELLSQHYWLFYITDSVVEEITHAYPEQKSRLDAGIKNKILTVISVDQEAEIEIFSKLVDEHRLGVGECSAIACAINRGYHLDRRATNQARKIQPNLTILTTQEIMIQLVKSEVLSIEDADGIKSKWESEYRFRLRIESFKDIF